jgi:3-phenylpropionate/trans-cinnamate dioxygenase ferredoxin subunit
MVFRIGNSTDIPAGEMHVFTVAGTKVTVANADGHLYAFDDRCTHTGCSLSHGRLNGTTVTCPCHGSQFDITTGKVLRGPAIRAVGSHRVEVEGGQLLVDA